jgi:hypothetical protein
MDSRHHFSRVTSRRASRRSRCLGRVNCDPESDRLRRCHGEEATEAQEEEKENDLRGVACVVRRPHTVLFGLDLWLARRSG